MGCCGENSVEITEDKNNNKVEQINVGKKNEQNENIKKNNEIKNSDNQEKQNDIFKILDDSMKEEKKINKGNKESIEANEETGIQTKVKKNKKFKESIILENRSDNENNAIKEYNNNIEK